MTSESLLLHAIAGTLANILSITLVFPFDTARTRLQTQDRRKQEISIFVIRDIVKHEGWQNLYLGWSSLILSLSITNFVYFYIFNCLKSLQSVQTVQHDFLFGIVAGFMAVLVSNPFWVVNTRLKLSGVKIGGDRDNIKDADYKGILDCFKKIYNQEGFKVLFIGLKSSLTLVSNPAINFMTYELLKRLLFLKLNSIISSSFIYFIFGAISKFVATISTYPLQVIQTRSRAGLQILSTNPDTKHHTLPAILFLFRGLESKLTQTVLTSAIMFLTYENLRYYLLLCVSLIMESLV